MDWFCELWMEEEERNEGCVNSENRGEINDSLMSMAIDDE